MSVYKVKSSLLFISAYLLTACGGGGGSDDVPLSSPYTPSVLVAGLDVGAAETVVFNLNGEAITATNNVRYNANSQVVGSYSAFVVTSPAGKTCTFTGGTTIYNGSAKPVTLTCGAGLPGGGGGGGGTPPPGGAAGDIGNSPFQVFAWGSGGFSDSTRALITSLISLTDFSNRGLTNATTANFSFSLDDAEIIPGPEHRFHIEPLNNGLNILAGAIAVDISTNFTDAEVASMKQQLDTFLAGTDDNRFYRISWFDDRVVEEAVPTHPVYVVPGYTNNTADLQAAVANIPDTVPERGFSTDLYAATRDAATSVVRSGPLFDYVVIISDGDHSSTGDDVSTDYLDETEFNLIFAIAVGPNADMARMERVITVENEGEPSLNRILQISDVSQLGAALQTIDAYVGNMEQGLHGIYYVTPRRDDPELDPEEIVYNFTAVPLEDCAAADGILGCSWDREFDPALPTPYQSPTNLIWAFANSLQPLVGDTVRLRIPDWPSDHCSSSINYDWNLTVNSGAATLSAPRNNAREIDVIFDAGGPSSVTIDITNASLPGCFGSIGLSSAPLP